MKLSTYLKLNAWAYVPRLLTRNRLSTPEYLGTYISLGTEADNEHGTPSHLVTWAEVDTVGRIG